MIYCITKRITAMYIVYTLLLFVVLIYMCTAVSIKMQLSSKVLDTTDDDITDNCDYLDDDNDLNSILGKECDINIVQSNIRGLIGKQSVAI